MFTSYCKEIANNSHNVMLGSSLVFDGFSSIAQKQAIVATGYNETTINYFKYSVLINASIDLGFSVIELSTPSNIRNFVDITHMTH